MMAGVAVSMVMDEALFCLMYALAVMAHRPMTIFGTYYVMYYNLSADYNCVQARCECDLEDDWKGICGNTSLEIAQRMHDEECMFLGTSCT